MESIKSEIDSFYSRSGRAPSTRELADILPLSHNSIARYLREMNEKGMLEYDNGRIVTAMMSKIKPESVTVPILGSISCGILLTEEENVESYVRLPIELVGRGDFFFLKANGDSMIEAGIDDG
ncbi:MAG: repressor LexA, partial [Clostridiales bacterium]|nr:repressor LexA [Clostridiales bacterium]